MTEPLETLTRIAARILYSHESEIDPDVPFEQLNLDEMDVADMFEEACEIHGVPLIEIFNTMPIYRFKRSDIVMHSLVDIAAFSPRAANALSYYTTRVNIDTLRNMARSIEERRYIPSGLMSEDIHQPNQPKWVIGKGLGLAAFAIGLPMINAFGPCNPICRDCFAPPSEKFWEIGAYSLPFFAAVIAIWFGPGLYDLWQTRKKQERRQSRS